MSFCCLIICHPIILESVMSIIMWKPDRMDDVMFRGILGKSFFHFIILPFCHCVILSFQFVIERKSWYCFAVNKYGDEVKILMELTLVCHFVSLSSNHSETSIDTIHGLWSITYWSIIYLLTMPFTIGKPKSNEWCHV